MLTGFLFFSFFSQDLRPYLNIFRTNFIQLFYIHITLHGYDFRILNTDS